MTQKTTKKDEFDRLQDSITNKIRGLWNMKPTCVFCCFSLGEGDEMQVGYILGGNAKYLPGILAHSFSAFFRGVDDPSWFFKAVITEMAVIRGDLVLGEDGRLYEVYSPPVADDYPDALRILQGGEHEGEAGSVHDSGSAPGGRVVEPDSGDDTTVPEQLEVPPIEDDDRATATEGAGVVGDEDEGKG